MVVGTNLNHSVKSYYFAKFYNISRPNIFCNRFLNVSWSMWECKLTIKHATVQIWADFKELSAAVTHMTEQKSAKKSVKTVSSVVKWHKTVFSQKKSFVLSIRAYVHVSKPFTDFDWLTGVVLSFSQKFGTSHW